MRHISVDDGLSQSSVYCLAQDRQGFLWFGTADGLDRYDGYTLRHFRHASSDTGSLGGHRIGCLYEDENGVLWIGTDKSLSMFDAVTGGFRNFPLTVQVAGKRVLPEITEIRAGRAGGLIITTSMALFSFDVRTHSSAIVWMPKPDFAPGHTLRSIAGSPSSYVVGTQRGIFGLRPSGDSYVEVHLPLPRDVQAEKLFLDSRGFFWIGTMAHGAFRVDSSFRRVDHYHEQAQTPYKIPSNHVLAFAEDSSGRILMGLGNGSVALILSQSGGSVGCAYDTTRNSFAVTSLMLDRSGLLWAGTDGGGVLAVDMRPAKFHHYLSPEARRNRAKEDFLKAVLEDRDSTLWLGTYGRGLLRFNRRTNTWGAFTHSRANPNSIPSNNVFALQEDAAGTIWVGTDSGLAALDKRSFAFRSFREPVLPSLPARENITTLSTTADHKLLVGSQEGIRVFDPSRQAYAATTREEFPGSFTHYIRAITQDSKGNIWLGTYGSGLFRYDTLLKQWKFWLNVPGDTTSISNNVTRCILEDRSGILWLGTEEGLNRFDPRTSTFRTFTHRNGLPNDYIYAIQQDASGNLWISTNRGLSRFDPLSQRFRNYGPEDGLQSHEFNTGAYFQSPTGEMFFGGINGLNAFHPDSVRDNPHLPQIVLTDFKIFDMPVQLDTMISRKHTIVLRHDQTVFSFQYAGLEFTNPAKNQYAYMLEGFDEQWISCGTRREARYTNLAPGEYVFRVKASNNDGIWNEQPLAVRVVIVPPFWTMWWFRGIAGLFLLGAIAGGIRYFEMRKIKQRLARLEQERSLERERSRLARDMHDELGANLTSLSMITEIARRSLDNPEQVEEQLHKAGRIASETVRKLDEIVWAVNPKADNLANLAAYLSEYAEEFFGATPVSVRFAYPERIPDMVVASDVRHCMFLVAKEAMNNIVKHSRATTATIRIAVADARMALSIEDNGKGCPVPCGSQLGNGICNMRQRVESVGGTMDLYHGEHGGTVVRIEIPV